MSDSFTSHSPARSLTELIALLTLERLDATTYRGRHEDPGWGRSRSRVIEGAGGQPHSGVFRQPVDGNPH